MRQGLLNGFLLFICLINPSASTGFQMVEDGSEMVRVDIKFASETSGIIEAFECNNCPPKSYTFNETLIVYPHDERSFTERLKALNGKPVVLTWKLDTSQALRIIPNF